MNFKEIQLVGFKSFADKTSVKFDDGVTCIVGPNGCGKSNVADAVRWVLGEQSAKTLRGTSMQDVIFNGTESRRALSYCEVTLVFDNSTRLFDIEYEEVAMTRRLYRSGESEYLLNKQPCRLRDIVALLHGVGIGKEGYSIIGQGKVEQIMNAKPEDRRAIFEEATGVMKFKTQKGEIERKLENASENRTVFLQRIDEAESQLRPLEKQAETAKKYREFSTQLQYEEVNTYLVRSETFTAETDKHRAKIKQAEERLSEVELRLTAIDMEERDSREKVAKADDTLRSLNDKLRLFEVGLERKSGEAKVIGEQIRSYRTQLSRASDDVEYSLRRALE
ncbi:MAG: AAA family ATPase, partial [Clostridiales bacterium]|nr:AAA family ATPase [Clostridiales bacterium]